MGCLLCTAGTESKQIDPLLHVERGRRCSITSAGPDEASNGLPLRVFDFDPARLVINTTLEEFTLFSMLPPELRTSIWEYAIHDLPARIVVLEEVTPRGIPSQLTFKHPFPDLAYVCHDTSHLIRSKCLFRDGVSYSSTQLYFNADKDTILLGPKISMNHFRRLGDALREGVALQRLAIRYQFFERNYSRLQQLSWPGSSWNLILLLYDSFPALGKLTLIPHHLEPRDESDMYGRGLAFRLPILQGGRLSDWEEYVTWARGGYDLGHKRALAILSQRGRAQVARERLEIEFTGLGSLNE